ncbi:hypothetical protein niasHS_007559 [Heterodera schachtii]|uniref:Phosphoinositide phospholipase C n=1 Tax=Heterodera schachtii TaxID=97005 RepID=A0ABD2JXU9_HETSC
MEQRKAAETEDIPSTRPKEAEVSPPRTPLGIPPAFVKRNSPLRSSLRKHCAANGNGGNGGGNRQKSPAGRKTVSFCSQNAENKKVVSNVADCIALMQAGTELVKLRTNVRQFRRVFSLDSDMAYIRWTPTNKKPHKARIAIEAIKEVRVGWNSELLRITEAGIAAEIQEECAFSIIHGDEYECLDLIALNAGDANVWVTGLMALASGTVPGTNGTAASGSISPVPPNLRERWLATAFREADADKKGTISEKAAMRLIRSLNTRLLTNRISKKVKEVGTSAAQQQQNNGGEAQLQQKGRLDEAQFIEAYKDMSTRPEIYFLMVRYANKDYLNTNDLQLFLETEQGLSGVGVDFCENLIDQCEPSAEARELNVMTVDGFTNFLLSHSNSVFDVAQMTVCQDMSRPFSHYFISTSFNTYLVEDQLKGPSSVDGYISALKRNCRFIEMDVWEEAGGGELVVFNGGTMTSKLALSDVLDVITELAFERTRYPLFVRLELHLHNVDAQRHLLALMEQKLGSRLYRPSMDPTDWTREMPTPKRFLNKIILSGVRYEGNSVIGETEEEDESAELISGLSRECPPAAALPRRMQLIRELRDLIAPFAVSGKAKEAKDFERLLARRHIVSMSEGDCLRLVHSHPSSLYRNFLLRVTPNAQRVDSSNLNPQEFWNFGFSLVALNYQTPGLMMDLQEGKFLANGGCGYVLKPAIMCSDQNELISDKTNGDENADEQTAEGRRRVPAQPQILHLKVLSAQQLPRPRASTAKGDTGLDPFVVLEVFGVPADCAEERSKTVRNDSFNPSFDESFQFVISVPELALVRFLVLDDDFIGDDFIGQYTIPFECLQSGYRHIPLLNNEGDPLEGSTLFVHIAITNRRGGGKPKKRGLSVKRKMSRVQTGMKSVGIRSVDDLFKMATGPLVKFIEMKGALEAALNIWNEESGVGQNGSMRQGIVRLHGRVAKEIGQLGEMAPTDNGTEGQQRIAQQRPFAIVKKDENQFLLRLPTGQTVPESLQKALNAFNALLTHSSAICHLSDALFAALSDSTRRVAECSGDLAQMASEAGLRGQKATRASENFAWNERLLKAQLGLMQSTLADARDILAQVAESGRLLGLIDTADGGGGTTPQGKTEGNKGRERETQQ